MEEPRGNIQGGKCLVIAWPDWQQFWAVEGAGQGSTNHFCSSDFPCTDVFNSLKIGKNSADFLSPGVHPISPLFPHFLNPLKLSQDDFLGRDQCGASWVEEHLGSWQLPSDHLDGA